jgi:hypothetical protein
MTMIWSNQHASGSSSQLLHIHCTIITLMQQEPYQNNGPSPPQPSGSLHFQKMTGFTVHNWKADDKDFTSTHCHTKIQLDSHGALQLTTEVFTAPSIIPKATTAQQGGHLSYPWIPTCNDRLPPEVNLGSLDTGPRQLLESVSSIFVSKAKIQTDLLIRTSHSSHG